jgi:hypothetical protein
MRNAIAVAAILTLTSVVPAMAATCPGTPVFQDAFTTPNSTLNIEPAPEATVTVKDGKAEVVFLQQGKERIEQYHGAPYGDVNLCLTIATPATDKAEDQSAGLVFWATDYNNYSMLEVSLSGQLTVIQEASGGNFQHLLPWHANAALAKGAGASNTLRVQTKGNVATFFVNDQQVGTVTGTPPSGGGLVGFYASSSSTSLSTWDFSGFSVATP